MSATRGRMIRAGGLAVQGGAAGRVDPGTTSSTGASSILRPAYSFNAGILKPTMPSSLTHVLDVRSVLFWRLLLVGLAVGYIAGWHLKVPVFGRVRV